MKIEPKFTRGELKRAIQSVIDNRVNEVIRKLSEIGTKVVTAQRLSAEGKDYNNRTGNLRSSIGYVIVIGGKEVGKGGFEPTPDGSEGGRKGMQDGLEYARKIASKYRGDAIQLVVVAGMNYARYVDIKGYDVLSTAELVAERMISELKRKGL